VSYLVDTNVLSELRKGPQAHGGVLAWDDATSGTTRFISVVVLGELRKGARARTRKDPLAGAALDRWIDRVAATFNDRILPVDVAVAEAWAEIMVPNPRPPMDALIAATALVHGLVLITRNTPHFAGMGITTINPWTFAP